jgi:hypothetical protein
MLERVKNFAGESACATFAAQLLIEVVQALSPANQLI